MNKKTIKIMTIILAIGISVPVIVAGTSSQEHIIALFSPSELSMNNKKVQSKMFFTEDFTVELEKVERISEDDFTIRGKWGIYDNNMEGIFKGFQDAETPQILPTLLPIGHTLLCWKPRNFDGLTNQVFSLSTP